MVFGAADPYRGRYQSPSQPLCNPLCEGIPQKSIRLDEEMGTVLFRGTDSKYDPRETCAYSLAYVS